MTSEVSAPGGNVVEITVQHNEQIITKKGLLNRPVPNPDEVIKILCSKILFLLVGMLNFHIISYKRGLLGI